jgi:CO/xanthine dehydrogenase Mo-binding subunit
VNGGWLKVKDGERRFPGGPRLDAVSKVTGREKYAADLYSGKFLWAGVKRALVPHARLTAVHTESALTLPGIQRVLTHRDIAGSNRVGLIKNDQPVLVDEKIRHAGDAVALVLAESREILTAALGRITFDHEPLPGAFDVEEALKSEAPKVHETNEEGNLLRCVTITRGDADRALRESDVVVEGVFETQRQEHAYLETEAGWAYVDDRGVLTIIASTQTPYRDRIEIAHSLGLEMEKVRVAAGYLGGAFGGKDGITVQCLLGLAALNADGVPVKMWWDRAESFLAGVKRLPARMYYRLGAKKDGSLDGLSCRLYFDAGAYAGLSGEIMTMGTEHAGSAYLIPNVSVEGRCVYTNNPVGGPFRGFGVPQVTFAMEQAVDMIAEKLSMDPLELRRKNALKVGDVNCLGVELKYSTGIGECIARVMEHPFWKERGAWKRAAPKWKKRGTGVGCMGHAIGYPALVPDQANAMLELKKDGTIRLYSSLPDLGQGNASTYLRIASAVLDQDPEAMEVVQPDTDHGLPSGSSSASRTTYTFGNAVINAAEALKQTILGCAARFFGSPDTRGLTLVPGRVLSAMSGKEVRLADIARLLGDDERSQKGFFRAPYDESTIDRFYLGAHVLFSYGAHLARIEVDTLTGGIEVKDYLAVTDAGAVIDRSIYDQQVHGSVAQGIGYALTEDYAAHDGMPDATGLSTYIIPTSLDLPDVVSVPVEPFEETGPFGMKGIGEVVISGCLPAISNAFYDACGVRITRAPLTQERVLSLIAGEGGGE